MGIVKYWKSHIGMILMIVLLLVVQAYSDLALPSYTADIVDTGITNGGIEYVAPEKMSSETYENITLFLSDADSEKLSKYYELKGEIYERNTDKKSDMEEIQELISVPALVVTQMSMSPAQAPETSQMPEGTQPQAGDMSQMPEGTQPQAGDVSQMPEGTQPQAGDVSQMPEGTQPQAGDMSQMPESAQPQAGDVSQMPEGAQPQAGDVSQMPEDMTALEQMKIAYENGMMTKEDLLAIAAQAGEKISEYGDSLVQSQGIAFVKAEYKKVGVNTDKIQTTYLRNKGLMMVAYAVLSMAAAILVGLFASILGAQIGRDLRNQVFKKVVSFSNAEIDSFQTSSLITRSTNDIQQIQMVTVMFLRIVLYAPILAIGGITKVLRTDTGLNWIIVVAVIVLVGFVMLLVGIAMPKFKAMQTLVDKLNLISREILTGVLVIRAFGREKEEEKRFEKANQDLTKTQLFTNRVMTFMMPVMMLIMNGVSVMIVWFGAKNIDTGRMQIGDMMAFITYTMQIIMSFLMLTALSIMLPRASVSSKRVDEVLTTDSTIVDSKDAKENDEAYLETNGVLSFENVAFAYPGASDNAVEGISFTAKPGTTTAIIGSTGAGKSTIMHLITRFYDVTSGKIMVDGHDIRDISQHKLRELLGFVPQKGVLFSGDIESNIKFAGDFVTDEDMKMAADISQSNEFILAKPDQFKSEIAQGGTNVSGGQKQRLSIARAVAKKPQIFLFDDSFSALDYKTDKILRKALNDKLGNSTIVIVAQRISTILHADNIIVLDDGKIVGQGTHEELMNSCVEYQEIAKSQLSAAELAKGGKN